MLASVDFAYADIARAVLRIFNFTKVKPIPWVWFEFSSVGNFQPCILNLISKIGKHTCYVSLKLKCRYIKDIHGLDSLHVLHCINNTSYVLKCQVQTVHIYVITESSCSMIQKGCTLKINIHPCVFCVHIKKPVWACEPVREAHVKRLSSDMCE